jgi:hypothetical protein
MSYRSEINYARQSLEAARRRGDAERVTYWTKKASLTRWQHFRDGSLIFVIWGGGALIVVAALIAFHLRESGDRSQVTNIRSTTTHYAGTHCVDVTSYDYNWNNDMFCTRPDGSTFYTSYVGAAQYDR